MEPAIAIAFLLLFCVGIVAIIFSIWSIFKRKKEKATFLRLQESLEVAVQKAKESDERITQLQSERNSYVERFKAVINADEEARIIVSQAEGRASYLVTKAEKDAEKITNEATQQLETIKEETSATRKKLKTLQKKVSSELVAARVQGLSFLKTAQKEALAFTEAVNKRMQEDIALEESVLALRRIKDGYGDEFIIPPQNFLDDLAEEFGFAEAAIALGHARNYSKELAQQGLVATCDYVENHRRTTAISFVADAFNGKIEAIINKVGRENVGILQKKVKDAFHLVNANGEAFRSARITPEYLTARLEEIKWGATVIELRERAKEEQRLIREQIREEEKARREHEKAIRDALKEEEKAQLALEKAYLALAKAETETMKEKLAKRIADLEEVYAQAKAREEQAISMAQLTRSGHVYIISNHGSFGDGVVKIGMTRRLDPMDRVKELGDASVPFPFDVHAIIYSKDAPALEGELQGRFNLSRVNKVNFRKEFFRVPIAEVKKTIDELGVEAHFTLASQCRDYRESLAIEQLPKNEQERLLEPALRRSYLQELLSDEDGELAT